MTKTISFKKLNISEETINFLFLMGIENLQDFELYSLENYKNYFSISQDVNISEIKRIMRIYGKPSNLNLLGLTVKEIEILKQIFIYNTSELLLSSDNIIENRLINEEILINKIYEIKSFFELKNVEDLLNEKAATTENLDFIDINLPSFSNKNLDKTKKVYNQVKSQKYKQVSLKILIEKFNDLNQDDEIVYSNEWLNRLYDLNRHYIMLGVSDDNESIKDYKQILYYQISEILYKEKKSSLKDILKHLCMKSEKKWTNNKKIEDLLNQYFIRSNGFFKLSDLQKEKIHLLVEKNPFTTDFNVESIFTITNNINDFNFEEKLIAFLKYSFIKDNLDLEYINSVYYYMISREKDLEEEIDSVFSGEFDFYDNKPIFAYSFKSQVDFLRSLNVTKISDLLKLSRNKIMILTSLNFNTSLFLIEGLKKEVFDELLNIIITEMFHYEDRSIYIIASRRNQTLEEIGKKLTVTRERVRQLQAITIKQLYKRIKIFKLLMRVIFGKLSTDKYLDELILVNYFNNEIISDFINQLIVTYDCRIKYYEALKIYYDSLLYDEKELLSLLLSNFKKTYTLLEYNSLSHINKRVVNLKYKKRGSIIVHENYSINKLIIELIDEMFPNGYRAGNETDYRILEASFYEKYGEEVDFSDKRAILGLISRNDYILIDRGTYLKKKYAITLPDDLKSEILSYIENENRTISYQEIFIKYEKQLKHEEINNRYHLKGLLDEKLPKKFKSQRDFIQSEINHINPRERIKMFIRDHRKGFNISEIQKKFKFVERYVIDDILYKEEPNGLLYLSNGNYKYIDRNIFIEQLKKEIKTSIEETFKRSDVTIINSRKIFSELFLFNREIFEKFNIPKNHFATFSLIKYLLPDDYYYSRPWISKENKSILSVLIKQFSKSDIFSLEDVKKFLNKTGTATYINQNDFLIQMSDDFVQINIDTMVNKDNFQITESIINDIKEIIENILNETNKISTVTFDAYYLLPLINYPWNKYLFAGFIRAFLSDFFMVRNTEVQYNITDYEISKK